MYVAESLWNPIKEGLIEEHKKIKLGSPLDADSYLSAVIDDKVSLDLELLRLSVFTNIVVVKRC